MNYIFLTISMISMLTSQSDIIYPGHIIEKEEKWSILQGNSYDTWVGWLETPEIDWCRTVSVLPYSLDKVSKMIEDLNNYKNIFDRVTISNVVADDVVYIKLDMPFPISDRDYIVKYTTDKKDEYISYRFKSVNNLDIPATSNCIRLINATGEWYLVKVSESTTKVAYTWNGELAGDFPDWALTKAWTKQGNEMIDWLNESLEELYKEQ